MDLLSPWIPAIRRDGSRCRIAPWQLVETDNPVIELDAPRADFQGGLYQFLIGLLQTCSPPEDIDEWEDRYKEPPSPDELKIRFAQVSTAFELFSEVGKPAFLQDLELDDGEQKVISALLIEAPGGKTLKDNLDFFIKRGQVEKLCPCCVAQALFTLQTNAPSGGVGHRVGLRGGGPLTTLVLPADDNATLWQKLWLNILDLEHKGIDAADTFDGKVFPWLAPTRLSDKTGKDTQPGDTHALQMYWGMPRRIRLELDDNSGQCDLCGDQAEQLVSHYRTKNYGVNYDGPWEHPLTPYRYDPKNTKPPLSLKGQKGGLSYRNWLGLILKDEDNGDRAAAVVKHFLEEKSYLVGREKANGEGSKELRLWCFGYDMDNMKARCWYEHQLPVYQLSTGQKPTEQIALLQSHIGELLAGAKDAASVLRKAVKEAWFRHPEGQKGDMSFVDTEFWSQSEQSFYQQLGMIAQNLSADNPQKEAYQQWYFSLKDTVEHVFDRFSLETSVEDLDLKRVFQARKSLMKKFHSLKSIKTIKDIAELNKEKNNG